MAAAPEAGWYDDGTGTQRWWDGSRWTEHYADLRERDIELRSDAVATAPTAPGWYDDGRGRQRWWDGARWTEASRFSGEEQTLGGLVVDGRWIHFGTLSRPIAGARASHASGAELLARGRLSGPAVSRTLFGASGPIPPRLLKRIVVPHAGFVVVDVAGLVWLAMVPPGQDAQARSFVTWINNVSDHYRYR
ncbi:DUF2510 domain-containing protein [Microbacterium ulmi]|uniref:DUF2510 domain-containing protein n=1 Tax=Microbacterium ulmi TaxID=179095 RepID=A0A7Y2Q1W7_9MICO|nr:DUF2510 domain-containing protein [Microbacterium ulmi]NII68612.1 hypothetical protein [Microbacterium ulmi]NNH04782.1 DUF2510 domain-containing protein [Microbacterium ulmi]